MTAAHEILRAATRDDHSRVDDAFNHFDLGEARSYRSFLTAHARAVQPIEWALSAARPRRNWRSRVPLLEDDLRKLGERLPAANELYDLNGSGELSGMLYVLEGSRLGGGVLSARVGTGLPVSYLSAVHQKGEWRGMLLAFDARAAAEPPEWLVEALEGARRAFALFVKAAELAPVPD